MAHKKASLSNCGQAWRTASFIFMICVTACSHVRKTHCPSWSHFSVSVMPCLQRRFLLLGRQQLLLFWNAKQGWRAVFVAWLFEDYLSCTLRTTFLKKMFCFARAASPDLNCGKWLRRFRFIAVGKEVNQISAFLEWPITWKNCSLNQQVSA